ncbi:hypothetical protein CEXT_429451 [Caerostris extrusa]|uniref:Uncharacterized protein n=1 Tax=Caerostris extrusa TaxID=172846 RepID=A0AAV4SZ36_CAEEX|nr:hypothetical protein CEXT_429451 [Caerostris extrusa]
MPTHFLKCIDPVIIVSRKIIKKKREIKDTHDKIPTTVLKHTLRHHVFPTAGIKSDPLTDSRHDNGSHAALFHGSTIISGTVSGFSGDAIPTSQKKKELGKE